MILPFSFCKVDTPTPTAFCLKSFDSAEVYAIITA